MSNPVAECLAVSEVEFGDRLWSVRCECTPLVLADRSIIRYELFASTKTTVNGVRYRLDLALRQLPAGEWALMAVGGFRAIRLGPDDLPRGKSRPPATREAFNSVRDFEEWANSSQLQVTALIEDARVQTARYHRREATKHLRVAERVMRGEVD